MTDEKERATSWELARVLMATTNRQLRAALCLTAQFGISEPTILSLTNWNLIPHDRMLWCPYEEVHEDGAMWHLEIFWAWSSPIIRAAFPRHVVDSEEPLFGPAASGHGLSRALANACRRAQLPALPFAAFSRVPCPDMREAEDFEEEPEKLEFAG